jgi:hypothetical protein
MILLISTACRTPPKTDMRMLVPNDSIVYLETNNVAKMLESLTQSPAFQELTAESVDFSNFANVQFAVAVTNFEFSENADSANSSVINFKPKFVAVAETHAWSWQARSLAENQFNNFVVKNYGQDARLEKIDKDGGEFLTWTAGDGRKAFAFVRDSLIYFGNDSEAIDKCLAVKKGEAESLIKNESLRRENLNNNLAYGYVSAAGIEQFANLAGVALAVQSTEEADGRNFIARILPEILRKTTKEIFWTATKTDFGIEDKFTVVLDSEVSIVIKESLVISNDDNQNLVKFLPQKTISATRYNLKNPPSAWRNLLELTARNIDVFSGKLLIQFSGALLEPYKISDAEMFLNSITTEIITAQFDEANEKSVVIAAVKNVENLKKSISSEINFNLPPTKQENAEIWISEDKNTIAAFVENTLILGERESVLKCLQAGRNAQNAFNNQRFKKFTENSSVAATFGKDTDSADKIAAVLAAKKNENRKLATFYLTETTVNENGFERKTVSDFGLIGTIMKQFAN